MPRISRMRSGRAIILLLAAALGFFVFQLYEDFTEHKTLHPQGHESHDDSQRRRPKRNSSYVYSWPTCEQNKSVENITGFSSLPVNAKDFMYYQHCRHFPMLLDLPDKCGGPHESAEIFLLLVIKTSPVNYERREVLRKSWAKERIHNGVWIRRVFISGASDSISDKKRLNKLLEQEQREYSDILQWDFRDTFYNLTLKQVLFLEWMERNCPKAHFLLNGDDDVFANTDNMVEYLQSLEDNDGSKHLFIGNIMPGMGPIRDSWSRYFVPVQVHESESYPIYCSGGGFLLSGYTASVIYNMCQSIRLIPIDDAYMGMCLAKAGLRPDSHIGVKTFGFDIHSNNIEELDPCFFKEILLVHRYLPANLYSMWQRVHDPNLKCA